MPDGGFQHTRGPFQCLPAYSREHAGPAGVVEEAQTARRMRGIARVDEGGLVLDLGGDFAVQVLLPGFDVVFVRQLTGRKNVGLVMRRVGWGCIGVLTRRNSCWLRRTRQP